MASSTPGTTEPPSRPRISARNRKAAWGLVALGMVGHALRSRTFHQGLAVAAIALISLKRIGQEGGSSALARLVAWNRREIQRLEHKAKREAH